MSVKKNNNNIYTLLQFRHGGLLCNSLFLIRLVCVLVLGLLSRIMADSSIIIEFPSCSGLSVLKALQI